MFKSLYLKEYGGVKKCEKPLEFKKFTVLIGPNNSAKTTVLTALFHFPIPKWVWGGFPSILLKDKPVFIQEYLNRPHRSLIYRYSGQATIEADLEQDKLKILKIRRFKIIINEEGERKLFYMSTSSHWEFIGYGNLLPLFGESEPLKVMSNTLLIPNSDLFIRDLENALIKNWTLVEKTRAHASLIRDLVRKGIVDDRFTEVNVRFDKLVVRKELPGDDVAYINLTDLGDGLKRFLITGLWLETLKPKVVLWDDLEASAHPSLVSHIIKWLASKDWQVIITTHSIDVLYELTQVEPEDTIILSLRKTWNDILKYKVYTLDDLKKMFDSGQDIRKILV